MNKYNAERLFHTLDDIFISSPYSNRISPITGDREFHEGVDYSANGKSIPIYALDDGEVLYEGYDNSTGAIICYIRFPKLDDHVGLYYHLANTVINKGDKVTKDTKIGMMGSTGYSTGNHLHFDWFKYSDYNKGFYDRNYEDFNEYIFPENRIKVTPVAERNENTPQIRVIVDNLRVRTGHSTNSSVLGFTQNKDIYNDLETYNDGTYIWHRIDKEQWIADNGEWLEILPVTDYRKLYESKLSMIESLNKQISTQNDTINNLNEKLSKINELSRI
jgi:murein DD-endopeptidase MepM/ murein hydrolase activator NlpD